jgi:hypothetical protein
MRYTAAFKLRGALAGAVAVEWTDAASPQGSNAGWEACVRLPDGDWQFADHDAGPAASANWRAAGPFPNIGLRYRLSPSGPWSPVSATRKGIVLGGSTGQDEPEEPQTPEQPAALSAGEWSVHGLAPDPAVPNDPRRAAVIAVPTSSPAHASDNVRWQVNGDEPADVFSRAMTLLTTAGPNGEKLWRTTSSVAATDPACPHLRAPGTIFDGLRLFYTIDGVRSFPSTTARNIAVPVTPPGPDPDPQPDPESAYVGWNVVDVTPSNRLTRFAASRSGKTAYRMAPGVYDESYWPSNVTDHDIALIPLDRNNPPVIRGLRVGSPGSGGLSKGSFAHLANATKGTNFTKRIIVDGLDFRAVKFTAMNGVSTISGAHAMPDAGTKGGLGWRVYRPTPSHPSGNLVGAGENAGYYGLQFYTNAATVEVKNCLFDGYSIQLGWYPTSSGGSIDIHHNDFIDVPEDVVKFVGGNVTFRDNYVGPGRRPTDGISNAAGGIANSDNPRPHADVLQSMGTWTNLRILRNFIMDDTGHLAGGQIKSGAGASGNNTLLLMEDNELLSSANTAWWINNFERLGNGIDGSNWDVIIRGNKHRQYPGSPWGAGSPSHWGNSGADYSNARVLVDNNVGARLRMNASGVTYTRNVEVNNGSTWPVGWTEIARDRVAPGRPFSGRYGATAGVPA